MKIKLTLLPWNCHYIAFKLVIAATSSWSLLNGKNSISIDSNRRRGIPYFFPFSYLEVALNGTRGRFHGNVTHSNQRQSRRCQCVSLTRALCSFFFSHPKLPISFLVSRMCAVSKIQFATIMMNKTEVNEWASGRGQTIEIDPLCGMRLTVTHRNCMPNAHSKHIASELISVFFVVHLRFFYCSAIVIYFSSAQ